MLQYPIAMDPSKTWASPVAFVKSCEVIVALWSHQAGEERARQCLIRKQGYLETPRGCGRGVPSVSKNMPLENHHRLTFALVKGIRQFPLAYGSHFFWGIRRQQEKRERSSFWQVIVLEAWPTCANGCVACHPFHRHNWHQAHWLELSRPVWLWMALASLLLAYTTRFLGPESSDSLTLVAPFFCNDAAPETVIAGLEVPHQIDTCHIRSWGDITARNQFINQDVEVTNPCKPS